ncbi:hypothetical protein F511_36259 [Dorcoceras hygrometricum]|uniref:Uncharacterized protein n=1 Tax=Dorcoceras hygrometricum TaxID=472368 RepID=A0A2Z7C163_9LAMI|nr:hypothetical protein F511_36259 [Dorcoceras hygrometricum]
MQQLNDSGRGNGPFVFEVNGENEHRQTKLSEDLFDDNECVRKDSLRSEDSNELKGQSLQSSKTRDSRDSSSVPMTISDLYEADEDLYTDKNVLACEVPQLTSSYKETGNGHVVKDICVDEVVDVKEKLSMESCEVGTLVEKELPVEEFGTRSFLRSFLSSFEDEENRPFQPLPRDFFKDEVPATVSVESDPKGENRPVSIPYDSKIEKGSITFNFKYPPPGESRITDGRLENIKEQLELDESSNFLGNTNLHVDHISDSVVKCSSTTDEIGDAREQALKIEVITFGHAYESSLVQGPSYKTMRAVISDTESFDHKCVNSSDLSIRTADPHVTKKDHENWDDVSIVGPIQYDEGESSCYAGGPSTYSGPIAHSANLSLRSDSSAASGRSFAFPILQSEWNSSPARMAKGDGRRFRKHKGWRSGFRCCRF